MKKKFVTLVFIMFLGFTMTQSSFGQRDLNFDMVEDFWGPKYGKEPTQLNQEEVKMANKNLGDAIDPVLDMFGFLSGGGLYNTADAHGIMGFDIGVKVTAMKVSDDQLPIIPNPEVPDKYKKGPLSQENVVPIPVLHAGVGLLGNFEVMGRFFTFPMGEGDAEGNVTLVGLGAKYGLLQSFALPKVSVVAAYHYLNMPEEFDFGSVNNISGAVVVSKGFPFVTIYGGLGVDYSTLKIDLPDPIDDPDPFTKTNFRGNVGLKITPIPFLFINLDYNFGAVQGLSAGAGISIR